MAPHIRPLRCRHLTAPACRWHGMRTMPCCALYRVLGIIRAVLVFVRSGSDRSLEYSITQKAAKPVPAVVPDRGGRGAKMRGRRNKLPCSNTGLHRVKDHKHRWRVANFLRAARQDLGRIANFTRDQQRTVMLPMNIVRMEISQRNTRRCTTSISGENPQRVVGPGGHVKSPAIGGALDAVVPGQIAALQV